jgi:hypothetical protein
MDTASRTAAALGVDFGTHHTLATVLRDEPAAPFVWLVIDPDDSNALGGLVEC